MALPTTGPISLGMVRTELAKSGPVSLGSADVRALAGISGTISLEDLRGKSASPPIGTNEFDLYTALLQQSTTRTVYGYSTSLNTGGWSAGGTLAPDSLGERVIRQLVVINSTSIISGQPVLNVSFVVPASFTELIGVNTMVIGGVTVAVVSPVQSDEIWIYGQLTAAQYLSIVQNIAGKTTRVYLRK